MLVAAPVLVLATMYPLFILLGALLSARLGYFVGFVVYWLGWCLAFPLWVHGRAGVASMFRAVPGGLGRPAWVGALCLGLPAAMALLYVLPGTLPRATGRVVAASIALAAVNAAGEEVLWRGTYARAFPGARWLGYAWPALGFGLWHFAPQTVFPN